MQSGSDHNNRYVLNNKNRAKVWQKTKGRRLCNNSFIMIVKTILYVRTDTQFPSTEDRTFKTKITPASVSQSSTFNSDTAQKGVDGEWTTRAHVKCSGDSAVILWYTMEFFSAHCFSDVIVFQSHYKENAAHRMNGAEVYLQDKQANIEVLCGTIAIRSVWSKKGQTYHISCRERCGDVIQLRLRYQDQLHGGYGFQSACIHFREIEAYTMSHSYILGE